ncbi:MAG: type IIL restriction-modification enzyme MmeI, partial [bacterium]
DLMAILEQKLKPERIKKDAKKYPRMVFEWWKYWCARPELMEAIAPLERVLVVARVSSRHAFTFLSSGMVYSDQLIVIKSETFFTFNLLQSQIHELWVRFFGSSLEDRFRYTPT